MHVNQNTFPTVGPIPPSIDTWYLQEGENIIKISLPGIFIIEGELSHIYLSIHPSYLPTYLSIYLAIHPIYLSIHPSIHLSIHPYYQSIHPSNHPSILSACLPTYLSIYLPIYLFIFLSIHPSYLSIYLFIYLSIHPSIHLSVYRYLSVCLSVYRPQGESVEY